jgi:RNA polymerase sigma-70 factor (ECF subfamily)
VGQSDHELLGAWQQGDERAGSELVRRYFARIFSFFDGKVTSSVDDLVQRTFLACTAARERIDPERSFRTYLFGIARKQLLQHYARLHRDSGIGELGEQPLDVLERSPSQLVAHHRDQKLLVRALRSIPLDLQIVIELFYWEEMPLGEIAGVIEIPEGTVKSRLHRAKELLRVKIEALASSPELARTTMDDLERWSKSLRK